MGKQRKEQLLMIQLCVQNIFFSKNVLGNLNKDCERLFKNCECLKRISQCVPCLSLLTAVPDKEIGQLIS